MALAKLASGLTTLFGASASKGAGTGAAVVISFKPSELGTAGNVTAPETMSAEGLILALMQKINDAQGADATRALEIVRSTPFVTTRGTDTVKAERFTVTVYQAGVDPLDPDGI